MNKKADANMWWIIIGAVIALVVLIILMVIFTGKTGKLESGLSDCQGKGGVCAPAGTACPQSTLKSSAFGCETTGQECCIGSPKKCTGNPSICGSGSTCETYGTEAYCK